MNTLFFRRLFRMEVRPRREALRRQRADRRWLAMVAAICLGATIASIAG